MRSTAENPLGRTAGVALAAAVPLVILGNSMVLLLTPWTGDILYALPGFPADPLGLAGSDRSDLAETGIRSIWPVGEGTALLDEARLPDGSGAFEPKETRHMEDVRDLVRSAVFLWLGALVIATAALVALRRLDQDRIRRGLGLGARITLGLMIVIAVIMAIAFEFFFDGLHTIFFEGDSWQFDDYFTLRRIYPDEFWAIAGGFLALLALAQSLLLSHLTTGLPRPFRGSLRRTSKRRSGR
ncbi:MAG: DUF1461 domain-containing protein [Solirubrobacterales bacterium]